MTLFIHFTLQNTDIYNAFHVNDLLVNRLKTDQLEFNRLWNQLKLSWYYRITRYRYRNHWQHYSMGTLPLHKNLDTTLNLRFANKLNDIILWLKYRKVYSTYHLGIYVQKNKCYFKTILNILAVRCHNRKLILSGSFVLYNIKPCFTKICPQLEIKQLFNSMFQRL